MRSIMRNIYKKDPELVKIVTQGTVISHCMAEKYHCDVWGVIVTPRCDMAHTGKVTHVHYLPVVPFEEWYKVDGLHYLWTRAFENARRKILAFCKDHGFPEVNLQEKQLKKMCESLEDAQEKNSFNECIDNFFRLKRTNPIDYNPSKKEKDYMVSNLLKGDIHAFYLIEGWEEDEKNYKVVLLRDLKRLEYNVAVSMGNGIEERAIVDRSKNDLAYSATEDTFYSVVDEIISPNIEQLMESFSYNFCRIGVNDMDEKVEDELKDILK